MISPGKIVQLLYFQDKVICLTEAGHIFVFDPHTNSFEYLNEGIASMQFEDKNEPLR